MRAQNDSQSSAPAATASAGAGAAWRAAAAAATGRRATGAGLRRSASTISGGSADGKVLWVSGRYSGVVYALSTRDGKLLAKIPVGSGPHGLCVWPQPGRYSLGHTGILR